MSRGLRSRTTCVRLLMLAMAIQAMTPDLRDICSPSLFKLLDVPAAGKLAADLGDVPASDPMPESGDPVPLGSTDSDNLPDEVCLPGGCLIVVIVHRGQGGSYRPTSFPFGLNESSGQYPGRDVIRYHTAHIRATNVSRSLVRLTC